MPKVELSECASALKRHPIPADIARKFLEELRHVAESKAAESEEKAPRIKKQQVIILSDPHGKLPKSEIVGWVVQIPEGDSPATALDRVYRSSYDFNASKRGQMNPVATFGEALESVGAKFFKEGSLWVQSKSPITCLVTDNSIPKDEAIHIDRRSADTLA